MFDLTIEEIARVAAGVGPTADVFRPIAPAADDPKPTDDGGFHGGGGGFGGGGSTGSW